MSLLRVREQIKQPRCHSVGRTEVFRNLRRSRCASVAADVNAPEAKRVVTGENGRGLWARAYGSSYAEAGLLHEGGIAILRLCILWYKRQAFYPLQ